jgi:hypothetical protein
MRTLLAGQKLMLFLIQAELSGGALGGLSWLITSWIKTRFPGDIPSSLYAWTYIYFRPVAGHRLNYLVLCCVLGLVAVSMYLLTTERAPRFVRSRLEALPVSALIATLVLSVGLLCSTAAFVSTRALALLVVTCIPLLLLFGKGRLTNLHRSRLVSALLVAVTACAFILVFYENYQVIRGPVHLMNEYAAIYEETKIDGAYVNNKEFLDRTGPADMDVLLDFIQVKNRLDEPQGGQRSKERPMTDTQIVQALRNQDVAPAYDYARLMDRTNSITAVLPPMKRAAEDIEGSESKGVDIERLRKFYLFNYLEVYHQNMARGQVNHFGHVLNPINEYVLGRPLRDIYIQYGLGNTFLMKWVMDLFGGVSIQNYYKTYLFYPAYYLSYLVMLIYVFRSTLYVTGAFASLLACFFSMGYTAYIVAPGIIPSIHLLDMVTLTFFTIFLRRGKRMYLGIAVLLSLLAIAINRQFGAVLFLALIGSTALAILENRRLKSKAWPLLGLSAAVVMGLAVLKLCDYGSFQTIFRYLWAGFFSWPAPNLIVILTIIYLVVSYGFLLALRDKNVYLKYVYVFVFLNAQSTLLYYYWSGLVNHLPPVLPFLVLQLFIMLFILEKHLLEGYALFQRLTARLTFCAALLIVLLILPLALYYYQQKGEFFSTFQDHRIHTWRFERATLITTIDTDLIKESKDLIQKYGPQERPRIYIISKYDGLLPFVSERYSAFPMFDVSSYLFSRREYDLLLTQLRTDKPTYLFVDSDIYQANDPWAKLYHTHFFEGERASRIGRWALLAQLFDDVKNDYEMVEQGKLITVYKRKM